MIRRVPLIVGPDGRPPHERRGIMARAPFVGPSGVRSFGAGRPAALATTLALTALRLDGGSGSTLHSSGVLLQEGQLAPADIGNAALWVDGAEVSCYVEALSGTHADGSVISLLLQWTGDAAGKSFELRLGTAAGQSRLTKTTPPAEPSAVLLPSAAQMVAANPGLYRYTVAGTADTEYPDLNNAMLGGIRGLNIDGEPNTEKYDFAAWALGEVIRRGPGWAYAQQVTTAALSREKYYLDTYNASRPPDTQRHATGLLLAYQLTGHEGYRTRVGEQACYAINYGETWGAPAPNGGGGREEGRHIEDIACAIACESGASYGGTGPFTRAQLVAKLAARLDLIYNEITDTGSVFWVGESGFINVDGGGTYASDLVLHYMVAMMYSYIAHAFQRFPNDSAISSRKAAWYTLMGNVGDYWLSYGWFSGGTDDQWRYEEAGFPTNAVETTEPESWWHTGWYDTVLFYLYEYTGTAGYLTAARQGLAAKITNILDGITDPDPSIAQWWFATKGGGAFLTNSQVYDWTGINAVLTTTLEQSHWHGTGAP